MEHHLSRATIIPEIVSMIMTQYSVTEEEALEAFYTSLTEASLAEDETGLYGQSPLYIFGLFRSEIEERKVNIGKKC